MTGLYGTCSSCGVDLYTPTEGRRPARCRVCDPYRAPDPTLDAVAHGAPYLGPTPDEDGDAHVFVVLFRPAGGSRESPWSVHRELEQAQMMARAQRGRVLRVPYYDGVARRLPEDDGGLG